MAIFPKLSLWRRSLCTDLGGIDPEKLYRATLNLIHVQTFSKKSSGKTVAIFTIIFLAESSYKLRLINPIAYR